MLCNSFRNLCKSLFFVAMVCDRPSFSWKFRRFGARQSAATGLLQRFPEIEDTLTQGSPPSLRYGAATLG